jgi:hypothetical protein
MADDPTPLHRPDYPHDLRTYEPTGPAWAALPPCVRDAINRLRIPRCLSPYALPAVDRSPRPYTPPRKLFDEPSMLARAIARDGDPDGRLWQELLIQTAHAVDHPEVKRPAHRPKTLSRELAEYPVGWLLYVWDHEQQSRRWSLKKLLDVIRQDFGIPRSTALKMLHWMREREKHR